MRVRQQPRRRRRALRARARGRIELHLAGHGAAGPLPRRRPHAAVAAARGVGVGLRGRVLPVRGLRELAVPRRRRPASRDDARGLSTGTSVGDGCSHGADVRIGMEKDGPAAWCEASPPKLWRGEQLGDRSRACGDAGWRPESLAVWNSNLQPDFNVRICDSFDASSSDVLRELDESNRFVQKSAESTSI